MADTSTRISGPIEVKSDSAERVAFDLMEKIDYYAEKVDRKDPAYWLGLYRKCYKATNGHTLENILKD